MTTVTVIYLQKITLAHLSLLITIFHYRWDQYLLIFI